MKPSVPARRTVSEDVYRHLKRDILTLRHAPGSPLTENGLAERYGSSRVPVREACRRLQQEGLIESVPYKGYFTARISIREISDSFDLRMVLETWSVRRAVQLANVEDIEHLDELAAAEYRHDDWNSYSSFLDRNREYHLAVAGISGNARLVRVLSELIESMQRYFFLGLDLGEFGTEMRGEHEELGAAIRERDADRAAEVIAEQIERSRDRIIKALFRQRADVAVSE